MVFGFGSEGFLFVPGMDSIGGLGPLLLAFYVTQTLGHSDCSNCNSKFTSGLIKTFKCAVMWYCVALGVPVPIQRLLLW